MATQSGNFTFNLDAVPERKTDRRISKSDEKRFRELYEPTAIKPMAEALGRITHELDSACLFQMVQACNRMFHATNNLIKQQLKMLEGEGPVNSGPSDL